MLDAVAAQHASDQLEALELQFARTSHLGFTAYTFPAFRPSWHHKVVANALDDVLAGRTRRLIILEPPQNGKSEQVSRRFPAYALGRNPDLRILACSYNATLAEDMGRDVQKIMDTPAYRRVFPETRLATARDVEARTRGRFEVVGRRGYYVGTGIGGTVTGKSSDIGIIDDPIKNRAEAESATYRKAVWDFYASTFSTRQFGDTGAIIICLTRWHQDDLVGRLLKLEGNGGDAWRVIDFPAIYEPPAAADDPRHGRSADQYDFRTPGQPLWPDVYPLEELARRRAVMGEYEWASLYQQRPAPAGGAMVKDAWLARWHPRGTCPAGQCALCAPVAYDEVVQSWDCAFKDGLTNSWVVGQVWGRRGASAYLLDQVRGHWDLPATLMQVERLTMRWPQAAAKYVEDKANGPAVVSMLARRVPGLIAVNVRDSKEARLQAVMPFMQAGNVLLPEDTARPWVGEYVNELTTFPSSTHDDQVDATTLALQKLLGDQLPTAMDGLEDALVRMTPPSHDLGQAVLGTGLGGLSFGDIYGSWSEA